MTAQETFTSRRTSHPNQDRIIRPTEAITLTGLSRTTLWRLENSGDFPPRRRLSAGTVGWLKSEVEAWMEERQRVD